MLAIITFAALASAMPITTEHTIPSSTLFESTSAFTKRAADAAVKMVQRSVCDIDADGLTPHDCPHVNSVLRAAFALFCLFAFLVGLHVWQAAKYNKIRKWILRQQLSDAWRNKC